MNHSINKHVRNVLLSLLILAVAFVISIVLQDVFNIWEHITTIFVFAVFLISIITDGYLYGVASTFLSILAINYVFTYPYFGFGFTDPADVISAIAMLILSILTSTLTTKLKKWQEVKAESEKERMRANLLRAISHDLRTPLTTIYGAGSSMIENYDKLSDTQKLHMLGGIREDAEWLIRMVENLLSITRIDSGKVKILKTPTVLDELLDSVLFKIKKRYPEQIIEIEIPDDIVVIPMDAILIEQVIVNIIENTIHHAVGHTKLSLKVSVKDRIATFEFCDDGCGIPRDKLDSIFSGYNNLSEENTDSQKRNAGIGLSVCATIIKAHGGNITAENGEGGGAVFRFTLEAEEETEDERE